VTRLLLRALRNPNLNAPMFAPKMRTLFWLACLCVASSCGGNRPQSTSINPGYRDAAITLADFLLSQQTADGAIADKPGGATSNEDSNMEYALIGLAAAYSNTHDSRYLAGLESGIRWLAAREEMSDPEWRGSWFYTYQATTPYAPVPVSPGDGFVDARGVDSTSALFVYLLYLHQTLSGSDAVAKEFRDPARAALNFILNRNQDENSPFTFSSWHLLPSGEWHQYRYQYAADQGDVYLGFIAGSFLYEANRNGRYGQAAASIALQLNSTFFSKSKKRYATGIDEEGTTETTIANFDGIFPQGYLPWVFGDSSAARAAFAVLQTAERGDGSLVLFSGDPHYSLSVAVYAMAATGLHAVVPTGALDWALRTTYNSRTGAIRDTAALRSEVFSNVIGLSIVGLLRFPALP